MVFSMTGYGRGEIKKDGVETVVEIRSVNNRFCDVTLRIPRALSRYEQELKDLVKRRVTRGKINVSIAIKSPDEKYLGVRADKDIAKAYFNLLDNLRSELGLEGGVRLEHLLTFSDIFSFESESDLEPDSLQTVKEALEMALEDLIETRQKEGEQLARDLTQRMKNLRRLVDKIEKLSAKRVQGKLEKLREKVKNLAGLDTIDHQRLEMEVALLADRTDVTEECVRLKSHNDHFLNILKTGGVVGRKLDFLLQEMNREANTIGAKASDAEISHLVVEIKEAVEKIREQVQNLE